ncbi:MAG: hypothetical protein QHH27_01630 [Clostridia bacterium]|nr:hypothetical protein [Clostridia bacterium]MDH7572237.1 hypothetical protein [Clostridia bacterium]
MEGPQRLRERYIVDAAGRKQGVIIPVARYRRLLEDLHDLAVVAERREEASVPLEEIKHRLKEDGIL